MENINLYAILERYGIDVFVPALLVSVAILVISKLFPSLEKKHDFAIRSVLSVVFYAIYIAVSEKDAAFLIEKSASILGASYLIRLPYKKDDDKSDGNGNDYGTTDDTDNNDGVIGENEIDKKNGNAIGNDAEEVAASGNLSDSPTDGDRIESDTEKANDVDRAEKADYTTESPTENNPTTEYNGKPPSARKPRGGRFCIFLKTII